jgi:hypothetical protein
LGKVSGIANYPTIKFQSKKIEADGPEAYKVTGDLTIRGETREVVLNVTGPTPEIKDPWGYTRPGRRSRSEDQPQGLWPDLQSDPRRRRRDGGRRDGDLPRSRAGEDGVA